MSTAADQNANLRIVATTAGNGTTVDIMRTSQSAAISGKFDYTNGCGVPQSFYRLSFARHDIVYP